MEMTAVGRLDDVNNLEMISVYFLRRQDPFLRFAHLVLPRNKLVYFGTNVNASK